MEDIVKMEVRIVDSLDFNLYHDDSLGLLSAMSGLFPEDLWWMIYDCAKGSLLDFLYGESLQIRFFAEPRMCQPFVFAVDVDMLVFDPLVVALSAVSFAVKQEGNAELWDTWVDDVLRLDLQYGWRHDHVIAPDHSAGRQRPVEQGPISGRVKRHVQLQYAHVTRQTQITAAFFDFDFASAGKSSRNVRYWKELEDDSLTCNETIDFSMF